MTPSNWHAPVIPIGTPRDTPAPVVPAGVPSWESVWLAVAYAVSRRSLCTLTQVGAVVVSYDNRIVAAGHHGPPDGYGQGTDKCSVWCARGAAVSVGITPSATGLDCPSLHAEAHALMGCGRREREGGTLYVSGDVCFPCAKLVAGSGVDRLVYASTWPAGTGTSHVFLRKCGVDVVQVPHVDD